MRLHLVDTADCPTFGFGVYHTASRKTEDITEKLECPLFPPAYGSSPFVSVLAIIVRIMMTHTTETEIVGVHLAKKPWITVFGVQYLHLQLEDGSDLYLTEHGRPFSRHLLPENHWADKDWLIRHSVRLRGTSAIHKISTKKVAGFSKEIVLKWNRMGQDIPGETQAIDQVNAKFNSPFEEFSLVAELRQTLDETPDRLYTHKPLAIYVPRKYVDAWRLGRKDYIFRRIQESHEEIELDWHRHYAVIYEWIKGIDAREAFGAGIIDEDTMRQLMFRSDQETRQKGFFVQDYKPHHLIVRPVQGRGLAKNRDGKILYALVDFELLERTPQREQAMRASHRKEYLSKQAHRFEATAALPPHLTSVNIMGVDYVYGQVESTDGRLWVVGQDPGLFEYFLPERWRRTPRTKLSTSHRTYHTLTKDSINLVWRVSNVGKLPGVHPGLRNRESVLAYGYNSPFEEISLSVELTAKGIGTTYPRAIYMTGRKSEISIDFVNGGRYESHKVWNTPEGHPILGKHHDCITIWGYWNGPDELLAAKDEEIYKSINASTALKKGLIDDEGCRRVMEITCERLETVGIEDLDPQAHHLLLSLDRSGKLATDDQGIPLVRICNFELLRHIELLDTRTSRKNSQA